MSQVSEQPGPVDGVPVESLVCRMVGACLLGAAAIHAAFVRPHWLESRSHGLFFAVAAGLQLAAGLVLVLRRDRRVLTASVVISLGVIGVWLVSRTAGIDGAAQPVGLADAVTSALEAVVVAGGSAVVVAPSLGRKLLPATPVRAGSAVVAVLVAALSLPAVALAPSQHEHHGHDSAHAISHEHSAPGQATSQHDAAAHDSAAHSGTAHHAAGASEASAHTGAAHEHLRAPCPNPTAAEQRAADKLVQDTKAGTARLGNVETAKAEGYMRFGDGDIAGTWHYINWDYQASAKEVDPERPESIIYWQATPESPLILIGAMYITDKAGVRGPQVGGCLTQWHSHGAPFAPEGIDTPEMLHVWFVPLPGGPFVTDPSHPDAA